MNIHRIFLFGFIITTHMVCDGVSALVYGRSQVGFAEKVNAYVQRVRSGSSGKDGVGEVLGRAMLLTPYSSMRSVTAILNHLGPFLIKDKDTAANEACCASLVKIVVPVVEQFDQELFDNLYTIDRCLEYWEYQRLHPVSYFFHKSPLKYFTLGQQEEVADKIQFLKGEQQHHFALLGKINIHLSSFDADRSVDEQYAWIQQLCRVLFSYDVTSSISPDAELFPLLYESTNLVENYGIHMSDRLSNYHVPRVVMRRWLEGITAIAVMAYGAQKLYKNKDQLKGKTKTAYGTVRDEGRKMRDHYKAALFGDPEEEAQLLECYKDVIRDLNVIKNGMEQDERDASQFKGLWGDLPEDPDVLTRIDKVLAARMGRFAATRVPDMMGQFGRSFDRAKDEVREDPGVYNVGNIGGIYRAMRNIFGGVAGMGNDAKIVGKIGQLQFELLKKENRMMRAILYSAPIFAAVGAVAFGTYKLYKKIRGVPNYDPLRVDLVDMALLLNVYGDAQPADMDACDFGKLVYLAHKLQREEGRVPKQHRNGFMNEVSLLQRSSLTAGQKMRVIDLMYKKYTFLAQQGAGA